MIITGGNADGGGDYGKGGGLFDTYSSGATGSPTLNNVTITGNSAASDGGGIYNYYFGTPSLTDVTISYNTAGNNGGGLWTYGAPPLTRVAFIGNHATRGGGVYNLEYSPTLTNVTFYDNTATDGGGIYNAILHGVTLINVTFHSNHASGNGGALFNGKASSQNSRINPSLTNVILWGDSASGSGNEIYNEPGVYPGQATLTNSVIPGGCPTDSTCTNLVASDPMLQPLANNGGLTQNMALGAGSSAVDAGDDGSCPSNDQRGVTRPQLAHCDIGAYEAVGGVFDDVPVSGKEWMEPWIDVFYYHGITTGCGASPLIYCPESSVTRAAMAVFVLRAKHGASYVPPATTHTFVDMPVAGKEWMEPWVDQLYAEGITSGCGAGPIFCPENPVTRAAMAVFLLRALEGSSYVPPPTVHNFSDMPVAGKEWMEPFVDEFYSRGITTGCGAGSFDLLPGESV